jgi:hypothetical protein
LMLGKFAQFTGILRYIWRRISRTQQRVFDYKVPTG